MADYYISGVWKVSGKVTHVFLHATNGSKFDVQGIKRSEAYVINLIKTDKKTVYTLVYNYNNNNDWSEGAKVNVIQEGNTEYLRTSADKTLKDNLDNMLPMNTFL
jgi:hypothetical protein